MEIGESKMVNTELVREEKPTKRILCIGRIHKGKKTMIIAFPLERKKQEKQKQKGLRYYCPKCGALYTYPLRCEDCNIKTVRRRKERDGYTIS